jgi:hypothetical protein
MSRAFACTAREVGIASGEIAAQRSEALFANLPFFFV